MQASYEDAEKLAEVLRKVLLRKRLTKSDRSTYESHLALLLADAPRAGPSVKPHMKKVGLPDTADQLAEMLESGERAALTTQITNRFRRVTNLLLERRVGDPGRHVRPGVRTEPVTNLKQGRDLLIEAPGEPPTDALKSADWTGVPARSERLVVLRRAIPAAQDAVIQLIDHFEQPKSNGGPLLDEHLLALECLRQLHRQLGDFIAAFDRGTMNDDMGDGMVAELIRYSERVVDAVKDDPMPYALASLLYGVFAACGAADFGGLVAGAALSLAGRRP